MCLHCLQTPIQAARSSPSSNGKTFFKTSSVNIFKQCCSTKLHTHKKTVTNFVSLINYSDRRSNYFETNVNIRTDPD